MLPLLLLCRLLLLLLFLAAVSIVWCDCSSCCEPVDRHHTVPIPLLLNGLFEILLLLVYINPSSHTFRLFCGGAVDLSEEDMQNLKADTKDAIKFWESRPPVLREVVAPY